jgi:hypothetical protein
MRTQVYPSEYEKLYAVIIEVASIAIMPRISSAMNEVPEPLFCQRIGDRDMCLQFFERRFRLET